MDQALASWNTDRPLPIDCGMSVGQQNAIEETMEETLRKKFDSGVDREWLVDQVGDRCMELAPILLALFVHKGDGVDARQAFERAMESMRQDYVASHMSDSYLREEVTAEVLGDYS